MSLTQESIHNLRRSFAKIPGVTESDAQQVQAKISEFCESLNIKMRKSLFQQLPGNTRRFLQQCGRSKEIIGGMKYYHWELSEHQYDSLMKTVSQQTSYGLTVKHLNLPNQDKRCGSPSTPTSCGDSPGVDTSPSPFLLPVEGVLSSRSQASPGPSGSGSPRPSASPRPSGSGSFRMRGSQSFHSHLSSASDDPKLQAKIDAAQEVIKLARQKDWGELAKGSSAPRHVKDLLGELKERGINTQEIKESEVKTYREPILQAAFTVFAPMLRKIKNHHDPRGDAYDFIRDRARRAPETSNRYIALCRSLMDVSKTENNQYRDFIEPASRNKMCTIL